ncbi:MAG: hypothetical protein Q8O86_13630 [Dehalococcoidia bacterium]|nr:hypothetical protein [Dehalococcoidia bacterium]
MKKMPKQPKRIDISNVSELLRIVEEVRKTEEPHALGRDSDELAILMPTKRAARSEDKRTKTKADLEAFRSAFGAWKAIVDAELLKKGCVWNKPWSGEAQRPNPKRTPPSTSPNHSPSF